MLVCMDERGMSGTRLEDEGLRRRAYVRIAECILYVKRRYGVQVRHHSTLRGYGAVGFGVDSF